MKILHITKKYPKALGGDSVVVANLEKQQRANQHEVAILTSNCKEIEAGEHVHKFGLQDTPAKLDSITPRRLFSLAHLFVKSFRVIRKERPDIIHTHSIDMAFAASFAARWHKIPVVHTFHIVTFHDKQQSLLRRKTELLFKKGARPAIITAPDEADVSHLQKAGAANARLLPNGIDLTFWKRKRTRKPGVFTFISAGRFEEQKGMRHLITAAAFLKAQTEQQFKVQLVGSGSQQKALQALIDEKGLQDRVEILGRKTPEALRKLYGKSAAAVIPSLWESTPLTVLEAWAMQLPVISTPVGILQGDKHAEDVRLVPAQDPQALAAAMQELMRDENERERLIARGQEAAKQYSWNNIYATVDSLYKEAADKSDRRRLAHWFKKEKTVAWNQRSALAALSLLTVAGLVAAPKLSGGINTFVTLPLAVLVPGLLLRLGVFRNVGERSLPITAAISAALGLLLMTIESWLMSWLLPFAGVGKPLQTPYVIAAQAGVTAALAVWFWFAYGRTVKEKVFSLTLSTARALRVLVPLLLPMLAAAGAFRLNNSYGNQLTVMALALDALLAGLFLWKPKTFNPIWLLFTIALSLLLSTSLRSWYVSGFDISQEFQVFNLTLQSHHWNINALPGNAYNSCLSLTTLPTMMQQLTHVTPEFIYKYFYQLAFALTTVVVFVLARRFGNVRGAFASGLFYAAQAQFIEAMPAIVRQELSFLFFTLIIYLLLENKALTRARAALLVLLSGGMVVSHYSTTYVAIFILGSAAAMLWLLRIRAINRRLPAFHPMLPAVTVTALTAVLAVMSFTWYSVVNSSSSNLTNTLSRSWHSLVNFQGLSYTQNGERTRLILGGTRDTAPAENVYGYRDSAHITQNITPASAVSLPAKSKPASWAADRLRDLLAIVVKILLPVSPFILLVLHKTRTQVADLAFIGVSSVVTFLAFMFLPSLAQSYNIERVLQQALVMLSITGLWAMWVLLPARRMLNTVLTCSFVLLYLVCTPGAGIVNQVIGGTAPRLNMNNIGEEYQKYYTHQSETLSAAWLGKQCQGQAVWADHYATLRVAAYSDVPYDHIRDDILKAQKGCLMLDEANVKDNVYYATYDGGLARYHVPANTFSGLNALYTNGSSAVYGY
jgi:glycosyltransferase involved in cell wall biosynthesis/uncharacterized membrane protein